MLKNRNLRVQAVVFDWAGTTIDFGCMAPASVFKKTFASVGVEISMAEARGPMGMAKREHIEAIASTSRVAAAFREVANRDIAEADIDQMYRNFLPLQMAVLHEHSALIPGVVPTVTQLRADGVAIGSTTGYTRELMDVVEPLAKEQGYAADVVLCAGEVPQGRPAPFLLFEVAKRLGVYPLWTMVKVDDTIVGIEAGLNAGCWTVGVSKSGNLVGKPAAELEAMGAAASKSLVEQAEQQLRSVGAHFVIDSVADLPACISEINRRLAAGELPMTK